MHVFEEHLNIYIAKDSSINQFIERSIYGGRTFSTIIGRSPENDLAYGELGRHTILLDINSMYATCLTAPLPIGEITLLPEEELTRLNELLATRKFNAMKVPPFFARCQICKLRPRTNPNAPVPMTTADCFPTTPVKCWWLARVNTLTKQIITRDVPLAWIAYGESKLFPQYYNSIDIQVFMRAGWTIVLLEGIQFEAWSPRPGAFFANLYQMRKTAKKAGNKALEKTFKIIGNSIYGKFYESTANNEAHKLHSANDDEYSLGTTIYRPRQLGSYCLGYSRLMMQDFQTHLDSLWNTHCRRDYFNHEANCVPLLYTDTDSALISFPTQYNGIESPERPNEKSYWDGAKILKLLETFHSRDGRETCISLEEPSVWNEELCYWQSLGLKPEALCSKGHVWGQERYTWVCARKSYCFGCDSCDEKLGRWKICSKGHNVATLTPADFRSLLDTTALFARALKGFLATPREINVRERRAKNMKTTMAYKSFNSTELLATTRSTLKIKAPTVRATRQCLDHPPIVFEEDNNDTIVEENEEDGVTIFKHDANVALHKHDRLPAALQSSVQSMWEGTFAIAGSTLTRTMSVVVPWFQSVNGSFRYISSHKFLLPVQIKF
jgi:hypothetical protein